MRSILMAIVTVSTIMLSGCVATVPETVEESEQSVSIERDEFKRATWIRTPLLLSRQGFTDTFPVSIAWRAFYQDDSEKNFIQLYVTAKRADWGFYHSANGQDGISLEFIKIDRQVDANYQLNSVLVDEDFALEIPRAYLEKMASSDWKIKVYGKRDNGVFLVPKAFTQGFLNKVQCFEVGNCM